MTDEYTSEAKQKEKTNALIPVHPAGYIKMSSHNLAHKPR